MHYRVLGYLLNLNFMILLKSNYTVKCNIFLFTYRVWEGGDLNLAPFPFSTSSRLLDFLHSNLCRIKEDIKTELSYYLELKRMLFPKPMRHNKNLTQKNV